METTNPIGGAIAAAIDHAHEVALERLPETLPAAIERAANAVPIQTDERCSPWEVQTALANVGCFVSLAALAERPWAERLQAMIWALELHYSEQGTGTPPEERPQWLPGRDSAAVDDAVLADWHERGGALEAERTYRAEWREPLPDDLAEPAPAPSFLDLLEDIGDDDIITDLAGVGVSLEDHTQNDNAKWQVFADRLLASAQATRATLNERYEAERLQMEMIRNRYAETNATLEKQIIRTLELAQRIAENGIEYPKKAKSIKLPHGQIGYKDFSAKLKIEDKDAATAWAVEHLPDAVIERVITERKLETATILAHAETAPEPVPGVVSIAARREYYAITLD